MFCWFVWFVWFRSSVCLVGLFVCLPTRCGTAQTRHRSVAPISDRESSSAPKYNNQIFGIRVVFCPRSVRRTSRETAQKHRPPCPKRRCTDMRFPHSTNVLGHKKLGSMGPSAPSHRYPALFRARANELHAKMFRDIEGHFLAIVTQSCAVMTR